MKIYTGFKQGSDDWREARLGIPTASRFSEILSPTGADPAWNCVNKDGELCGTRHRSLDSAVKCCNAANKKNPNAEFTTCFAPLELAAASESYMEELIAERLTGGPEDVKPFFNADIERGNIMEPRARNFYEYETGYVIREVGFITTDCGRFGASPDCLVYPDNDPNSKPIGGVEFKSPKASVQVHRILNKGLPPEVKLQVHGGLVVSDLEWWDFLSFCPAMPDIVGPAFRFRVYRDDFTKNLKTALEEFDSRMNAMMKQVKGNAQ